MEIIRVEDSDLREIEGDRYRTFRAVEQPLSAQAILDDIRNRNRQRVLVICNTVSFAQGLYRDLEALKQNDLELTLLHSRFLPEDRKKKEESLERIFGKKWQENTDGKCQVLISTQVIEVGINITSQVLHCHLCPMSSLLQRAGRCARFGGKGEVYVYWEVQVSEANSKIAESDIGEDPDEALKKKPSKLKKKFLPYEDEICEDTWKVLREHNSSVPVGFRTEERWINEVHEKESQLQAQRRQTNRLNFEQRFNDAIFRGDRSAARELIRLVDNRNIFVQREEAIIDGNSQEVNLDNLEPFSLPVTALCKVWRDFQNVGHKTWIFRRVESPQGKAAETYSCPVWSEIKTQKELVASLRILVNPNYVYYDSKIGLRISLEEDEPGNFKSREKCNKQVKSQYCYHMDTYVGHLGRMWTCWTDVFSTEVLKNGELVPITYASVRDELRQAGGQFIQTKIFSQAFLEATEAAEAAKALFEILVFLAILTHDLGKLQIKWQEVMRGWQAIAHQYFNGIDPKFHLLAHTDFDPTDQNSRDAEGRTQAQSMKAHEAKHQRPPHAIESAFLAWEILEPALCPLLEECFGADENQLVNLLNVVVMAAGRHHSAWTNGWKLSDVEQIGEIKLHPDANKAIAQSWRILSRSLSKSLPETLALPSKPIVLNQTAYPAEVVKLNIFEPDQIEYQQLYALVVRALRLCDQRSVQLDGRAADR